MSKKKVSRTDVLRLAQKAQSELELAQKRLNGTFGSDRIVNQSIENALENIDEIVKYI